MNIWAAPFESHCIEQNILFDPIDDQVWSLWKLPHIYTAIPSSKY